MSFLSLSPSLSTLPPIAMKSEQIMEGCDFVSGE